MSHDPQNPQRPDEPVTPGTSPDPTGSAAPDGVQASPGVEPVPAEDELARVAVPARVRRAPKFGVFIVAGAVVGVVVGLLLTLFLGAGADDSGASDVASGTGFISFLDGQGAIRAVMGTAGAIVGGFVGGALAVRADRRSRDPLR